MHVGHGLPQCDQRLAIQASIKNMLLVGIAHMEMDRPGASGMAGHCVFNNVGDCHRNSRVVSCRAARAVWCHHQSGNASGPENFMILSRHTVDRISSRLRESGGPVQNDGPDAANMPATGIDLLRMVWLLYGMSGYQFERLSWWP